MPDALDNAQLAADVRQVTARLIRRMRAASVIPLPQVAVLSHLDQAGKLNIASLAALEGVRAQSMAQTIGELESAGQIWRSDDPDDGRKVLFALTEAGTESLADLRRKLDAWLTGALNEQLDGAERAALVAALPLLLRLADS